MSRSARLGLVVLAVVVAVAAFLIARPPGEDEKSGATPATQAPKPTPPRPVEARIRLRGGKPAGGAQRIEANKGEAVRITVVSDAPDDIHLHGYDVTRQAAPGKPARFRFEAKLEGEFELESHVAEDVGREPRLATVVVTPS